uniref:Uncharacterized protein n=1 Tax=Octopus bimaculoides TaxID=37653 RepID=A0A0L8G2Y3_OCTBM
MHEAAQGLILTAQISHPTRFVDMSNMNDNIRWENTVAAPYVWNRCIIDVHVFRSSIRGSGIK